MLIAIDIETDGLAPDARVIGIGYYREDGKKGFITDFTDLKWDESHEYVYHSGKFDITRLHRAGCTQARIDHDTLILASLLRPRGDIEEGRRRLGLEDLVEQFLGVSRFKTLDRTKMASYSIPEIAQYCTLDCEMTFKLFKRLIDIVAKEGLLAYYTTYVMPVYKMLCGIELEGVRINVEGLEKTKAALGELVGTETTVGTLVTGLRHNHADIIEKIAIEFTDMEKTRIEKKYKKQETIQKKLLFLEETPICVNFRSPVHMLALVKSLGVTPVDKNGKETVNTKILQYHRDKHPFIKDYMGYRKQLKEHQDLTQWDEHRIGDRLYGQYHLHRTRTGRLSSSTPNLQQVNKGLRELFVADEVFVIGDYSQIEARLAAHFSEDKKLIDVFKNNLDLYGVVGCELFKLDCAPGELKALHPDIRQKAKTIYLGIQYGMGMDALAFELTVKDNIPTSPEEASDYIKEFFRLFSGLYKFKQRIGEVATTQGYVKGWFGRKIWVPRGEARHKALNYLCQNAASELTVNRQVEITEELHSVAKLRLLTHDEVCYDCSMVNVDIVKHTLQRLMVDSLKKKLRVPLLLDMSVGQTWKAKE